MISNLWEHAFLTNRLLQAIYADYLKKPLPEIASAAGLLHNIGIVVMLSTNFKAYAEMYKKAVAENANLIDMEKAMLHVSHAEAGGYFLKWWELPHVLVETALYHHTPDDPRIIEKEVVAAVHVASKVARDKIAMRPFHPCNPAALELLGMQEKDLDKFRF